MFILRRINSQGIQMNKIIGDGYTYIVRDEKIEEFRKEFEVFFKKKHYVDKDPKSDKDMKDCYAFICNGAIIQPLYKNQKNFMMIDTGKTFANLSYK